MKMHGLLPVERAWLNTVFDRGYIDTFRYIHGAAGQLYLVVLQNEGKGPQCRVAHRLFFVSEELAPHIRDAWIEKGCPWFGPLSCWPGPEF